VPILPEERLFTAFEANGQLSQFKRIAFGLKNAVPCFQHVVLSLGRRAMEPGHLLHSALTRPLSAVARRLKPRHPFVPAAQQLISFSDNNNIRAAQWGIINGMRSGWTIPQDPAL